MLRSGLVVATLSLLTLGFGGLRPLSGEAALRRVDGVNASQRVFREAYVAPSKERGWGANRLKGRALAPGESVSLDVSAECGLYDVRFVADAGVELEAEEIDLCPADGSWLIIVLRKRGLEITTGTAQSGRGQAQ